jgi:hypothetical protein
MGVLSLALLLGMRVVTEPAIEAAERDLGDG